MQRERLWLPERCIYVPAAAVHTTMTRGLKSYMAPEVCRLRRRRTCSKMAGQLVEKGCVLSLTHSTNKSFPHRNMSLRVVCTGLQTFLCKTYCLETVARAR